MNSIQDEDSEVYNEEFKLFYKVTPISNTPKKNLGNNEIAWHNRNRKQIISKY